jgi:hypothetical protein
MSALDCEASYYMEIPCAWGDCVSARIRGFGGGIFTQLIRLVMLDESLITLSYRNVLYR